MAANPSLLALLLLPCLATPRVVCPGRELYFCSSVPGCIHRVHKCTTPYLACQENPGKDQVYINGDVITAWPCSHLRTVNIGHIPAEFDYRPIAVIAATGLVNGTVICVMLCVVTREIRQMKARRGNGGMEEEEEQSLPAKGQSCSGQWMHEEFAGVNHIGKRDGCGKPELDNDNESETQGLLKSIMGKSRRPSSTVTETTVIYHGQITQ